MPMIPIEFSRLTIDVTGPIHIGTGFARGLINRTIVRGRDGLVYIPGSTLKGKVRDACESLARLYGISDCRAPYPQRLADEGHRNTCLICRIFGAPALPSTLYWHNASLTPDWVQALGSGMDEDRGTIFGQTITRTQVQLSRKRGVAAEARLFTSEFTAEQLTFAAAPLLTGHLALTPMTVADHPDVYYELVLLLAGLKMINALGGGSSRGSGHCEFVLSDKIHIGRKEISAEHQLWNIEGLELYWDEVEALS